MAETAPAFKPAFQIKNENKPVCPECRSQRLFRDGFRRLTNGKTVQRWLCRSCGFRFSWPRVERQHGRQNLKTKRNIKTSECSSGALALLERRLSGAMNENEEKTTSGLAGATTTDKLDVKGKILEFAWYLKKNAYAESTVTRYIKALKTLQKLGADILNPENVKNVIAIQKWKEGTKHNYVNFYDAFARFMEIKWQKPKYSYEAKLPFLPLESEIDLLIHKMPRKISVVLQLIKETGARIGEALRLKWVDVDFQRNLITINSPEKHGKTRIFKVSKELIQRINMLPKKTQYVFRSKEETTEASLKISLTSNFFKKRKRLAFEYQNPRLSQIGFHTIRHWKATLEYHKTKDILHVKEMLGHVSIDNTLIYITLEKALFGSDNEAEFHSATAQTASEAAKLIEVGFDYVCTTPEGIMLFRKRK